MSSAFPTFDADAEKIKGETGANSGRVVGQGAGDAAEAPAAGFSGHAADTVDAGMEKAAGGLDALASTLREKADALGPAQAVGATAADKLQSGAELLRAKDADQLVADLEAFVRSKPLESLLIAFGIGFFLSKSL